MIVAAFVAFVALVLAWLIAPVETKSGALAVQSQPTLPRSLSEPSSAPS